MQLGELKVFVTVATEHSFSRAAIKLCRTQPAVSQAVRRLEEDLGELLFDRSMKSATLTQAGNTLLPEAIQLLRMADEAVATVRQVSKRERAVLRVGGDETDGQILWPTWTSSRKSEPGPLTLASRPGKVCRRPCAPCRYPSSRPVFVSCCRRAIPWRRGPNCRSQCSIPNGSSRWLVCHCWSRPREEPSMGPRRPRARVW